MLLDLRSWDGDALREASDDEAITTIVVGARKTGIAALLDLVPSKPPAGTTCARCAGTRCDPQLTKLVCLHCRGLGWEPAPAR